MISIRAKVAPWPCPALLLLVSPAMEAHGPGLPSAWSFDPWVVVPLVLAAVLYIKGIGTLWQRARLGHGVRPIHVVAFAGGWLIAVAALLSPLDQYAAIRFSAHMAQHELLMVVAAPLLVIGRPLAVWTWAAPPNWRTLLPGLLHSGLVRTLWAALARPLPAWLLHVGIVWAWHAPGLFEAAVRSESIHTLQHISFLGTALLVWWNALAAETRVARGTALLILFTTMIATGVLGALLAFSQTAWYAVYSDPALAYGIDPLADQQLGGVLMWVPGGIAYLIAGLAISARWLTPYRSRRVET